MRLPLAILAFAAVALSAAQQAAPVDRLALAQKMNAMTTKEWRPGVGFGDQLAELPSPVGFEILRENWRKGASVEARQQMFKGFVFNAHPDTLRVLNLGATDPDIRLQNWAFEYLKGFAFFDFAEDFQAYRGWYAKYGNRPLRQVVQENAVRFVRETRAATGAERSRRIEMLQRMGSEIKGIVVPEAIDFAREILTNPASSQAESRAIGPLLRLSNPNEGFYREVALPAIRSTNPDVAYNALQSLASSPAPWVTEEVLKFLKESLTKPEAINRHGFIIGMVLGERKDHRAIPTVIAAIDAHNDYDTVYGLGYFALSPLTGVSYDPTHDGAWWKEWWLKNRSRFPADVRDLDVPTIPRSPGYKASPKPSLKPEDDPVVQMLALLEKGETARIGEYAEKVTKLVGEKAIPLLIGVIVAADTKEIRYAVGYGALRETTGVDYHESHDGQWWRTWWEKNHTRYPKEMQEYKIPELKAKG